MAEGVGDIKYRGKEEIMSSGPIEETDVNHIRSLIIEDRDLAQQIREKAEMLYHPDAKETAAPEPAVTGRVGKEFIDLLQDLRSTLRHTHEALIGFNG